MHAARLLRGETVLVAPRDRFAQYVVGARRAEREHHDLAAVFAHEVDGFGDRTPAVRVHFQLEAVAHEAAVGAERHGLELRDLLDERGDAHGRETTRVGRRPPRP